MTSLFVLLGIAGFIGLIGGFISFFTSFTNGDEKAQLKRRLENIESQLRQLKAQLNQSPLQDENTQKQLKPTVVKLTVPVVEKRIENIDETESISDKELEQQALAANPELEITPPKIPVTQAKPEWKPKPKIVEPNFIEKAINAAKDWLFGGNTLVRSGIVILFIGISFLL
ncbi:MAG: hypothetical protein ACAH07_00510, partial [Methylophilaceae bacterium]